MIIRRTEVQRAGRQAVIGASHESNLFADSVCRKQPALRLPLSAEFFRERAAPPDKLYYHLLFLFPLILTARMTVIWCKLRYKTTQDLFIYNFT